MQLAAVEQEEVVVADGRREGPGAGDLVAAAIAGEDEPQRTRRFVGALQFPEAADDAGERPEPFAVAKRDAVDERVDVPDDPAVGDGVHAEDGEGIVAAAGKQGVQTMMFHGMGTAAAAR